jgi:HAD superfamily hydrolase (TIGR01509 family)
MEEGTGGRMDLVGVIFDFNGTMLFDRKYHLESWKRCVEDLSMRELSDDEVLLYIDGKGPKEILGHFLEMELTEPMILQFQEEKERIYRNMLMKDRPPLAPGLPAFLDYLRQAKVPMAIASSAPLSNMTMYYDEYELFNWFDWDHIVNASPTLPGKPHPALYQQAVKIVNVPAQHCLAFEDAAVGIEAAYAAGIRNIVHVTSDVPGVVDTSLPGLVRSIRDFTELK